MQTRRQIDIKGEYIKLDQLLKLAGMVYSGGHAKFVILSGDVKVNGQTVVQRGKKIRAGDKVTYKNIEMESVN